MLQGDADGLLIWIAAGVLGVLVNLLVRRGRKSVKGQSPRRTVGVEGARHEPFLDPVLLQARPAGPLVVVDASYRDGAGGWAAWSTANGKVARGSGALAGMADNNEAEVTALGYAIMLAIDACDLNSGSTLTVASDSLHAIRAFTSSNVADLRDRDRAVVTAIQAMIRLAGVSLRYRHVKAHQAKKDDHAAIQAWCDRVARQACPTVGGAPTGWRKPHTRYAPLMARAGA